MNKSQIRPTRQLGIAFPGEVQPRRAPRTCLQDRIDQLVNVYDSTNKPNATLYVTAEQKRAIEKWVRYRHGPLTYRNHPVVVVDE